MRRARSRSASCSGESAKSIRGLPGWPWRARRTRREARAGSAATTDEARRAGRAPGVGRRRREERAAIWQRGCRRAPPDRLPQPPWPPGRPPRRSMRLPPLYAIVDPLDTGRDPAALAAALLRGGARVVQLRWPAASARELLAAALAIRPLARAAGALFLVNDRPDVARAAEADGVHLGQDDLPVAAARRVLGAGRRIGVSTHDPEQARAAEAAGADYIGVG